jgi:hypothetical protein
MARKPNVPPSAVDCSEEGDRNLPFGANVEADPPPEPESTPSANGEAPADSTPSTAATPDPFNVAALRLSQDFGASVCVKKALVAVPVRKPANSWWVRVHPDKDYRDQFAVIELKEDREIYLVAPALHAALDGEATFSGRALFTAINRQGVLFLWPIRLPRSDGRADEWSRTAVDAANKATKGWVRIAANMALGAYDVFEATAQVTEPSWPDYPFRDLLRVAFKDRLIDTWDHPILRRLRGEA